MQPEAYLYCPCFFSYGNPGVEVLGDIWEPPGEAPFIKGGSSIYIPKSLWGPLGHDQRELFIKLPH